jgi:tellurite resistance protein TerC
MLAAMLWSSSIALVSGMPVGAWMAFFIFIAAMLAIDLGVMQRAGHSVALKEALIWCAVWGGLALGFGGLMWRFKGGELGEQYLASYLVELCLSIDNLFVFILVFGYFKVPARWQHRVLFWGIIGAVVMRTAFILVGVTAIARFHWLLYIFGAFLIYTGAKLALPSRDATDHSLENGWIVRLFRRYFPVSPQMEGGRFFLRQGGRLVATPLFIVLIVIETTDLLFALDSLPAVLAITAHPFVALTSNIFAILGLRSLYFALSGVLRLVRFLNAGLAVILVFIGGKMLTKTWVAISTQETLIAIAVILSAAIAASIWFPPRPPSV